MKKLLNCRRSCLALIGMGLLFILGFMKGADVAAGIAAICGGVAVANAGEKAFGKKNEDVDKYIR